jgi:bis(5'-nucleosyl)-tetraphosphatase (symmetrical)
MALYLIGDVQGCDEALARLLQRIDYSPSRDTLYMLGDMVNRGPHNAQVLRRLMGFGSSAQCILGNHDLHLLAVSFGVRKLNASDTIQDILEATDRDALLHWLAPSTHGLTGGQCSDGACWCTAAMDGTKNHGTCWRSGIHTA